MLKVFLFDYSIYFFALLKLLSLLICVIASVAFWFALLGCVMVPVMVCQGSVAKISAWYLRLSLWYLMLFPFGT